MRGGLDATARSAAGRADEVWTVLRLMLWSGEYLDGKGVTRGRLDAEHLLAHVLGLGRLQLYLQHDRPMAQTELDAFRPLLQRRARREPLQYILGRQAFRELELAVDPTVLIPRPETELLVDEVLAWAGALGRTDLHALDVGTGTGAIALSLASEGPFELVVATDVSPGALAVAEKNRAAAALDGRVELRLGSYFEPLEARERFDVVVSNPPYVAETETESLEPEVRDWEPGDALFAGPDGLRALRTIVSEAGAYVRPGGLLALEVGMGQAGPIVAMLEDTGEYDDVMVRRDSSGRERMVLTRRAIDN